jgi:predicted  nucleic acid-binding Zn-ribbon protein
MVSNELGQQLHARAVRGEALPAEEQAQLEAWYAEMDRAEMAMLNSAARTKALEALQAEVDAELARIIAITKRIQELSEENKTLRRENAALYRQLVERSVLQPV